MSVCIESCVVCMQACECCLRARVHFSVACMCVVVSACVRVGAARLHACVCSCECCVRACVRVSIACMHASVAVVAGVFVCVCDVFVFTTVARVCVQLKRLAHHIITR